MLRRTVILLTLLLAAVTAFTALPISSASAAGNQYWVNSCRQNPPDKTMWDGILSPHQFSPENVMSNEGQWYERRGTSDCGGSDYGVDVGVRVITNDKGCRSSSSNYSHLWDACAVATNNTQQLTQWDLGDPAARGWQVGTWRWSGSLRTIGVGSKTIAESNSGTCSGSTNTSSCSSYQWATSGYSAGNYGIGAFAKTGMGRTFESFATGRCTAGVSGSSPGYVRPSQCNLATDQHSNGQLIQTYDYNELGVPAGGTPSQVLFGLTCRPDSGRSDTYCFNFRSNAGLPYSGRFNLYDIALGVRDNTDPNLSAGSGPLWTETYLPNNYNASASFNADDNSGIRATAIAVDSTFINYTDRSGACKNIAGASGLTYNQWYPCPNYNGTTGSVNTNTLPEGAHTVSLGANDGADNNRTVSRTVIVDRTRSDCDIDQGGCSGGNYIGTDTPRGSNPNNWLSGDNITITGRARDNISGIGGSQIQASVNGGGWYTLNGCNNATAPPNGQANLQCTFDSRTPGFAENSTVIFRSCAYDVAGNGWVCDPNPTTTRRIDNTPPAVTTLTFSPTTTSWVDSKRWSNGGGLASDYRDPTTANWNVNPYNGSPIVNTYTTYRPGANCSPNARTVYTGTRTTEDLANNPNTACGQGAHQLQVSARDEAGNASSTLSDVYYYDSKPPATPGILRPSADPEDWTGTNRWTVQWISPSYDNTTQSPNQTQFYRFPQTNTDPARQATGCRSSNANCTVNNLVIPGTPAPGYYYYKLWYADAAGNADEANQSLIISLKYRPAGIVSPTDENCIVD